MDEEEEEEEGEEEEEETDERVAREGPGRDRGRREDWQRGVGVGARTPGPVTWLSNVYTLTCL